MRYVKKEIEGACGDPANWHRLWKWWNTNYPKPLITVIDSEKSWFMSEQTLEKKIEPNKHLFT